MVASGSTRKKAVLLLAVCAVVAIAIIVAFSTIEQDYPSGPGQPTPAAPGLPPRKQRRQTVTPIHALLFTYIVDEHCTSW